MSLTQQNVEDYVSEFFATKNPYQKYYSPENLNKIAERVSSFRIHPSSTAVKRAILELVEEDEIARADGKSEADDAREAAQAAEDQDRRTALATPLTSGDAAVYASLSPGEIAHRFNSDRVWRFRYEAACRLFGFRLPIQSNTPAIGTTIEEDANLPSVPKTAKEYHSIPTHVTVRRFRSEPRFRAAVQRLINEGKI
jgi:hypothetical protein